MPGYRSPTRARGPSKRPDLRAALDVVHPRIANAVFEASARLKSLSVSHVLVGALGVGAYGAMRATKDVDFLVGDEAFDQIGAVISMKPGLPISVGDVPVDPIPMPIGRAYMVGALRTAIVDDGVPVARVEYLVALKLLSPRPKDANDVMALVQAGLDLPLVRRFLRRNDPELLPRFNRLAKAALRPDAE